MNHLIRLAKLLVKGPLQKVASYSCLKALQAAVSRLFRSDEDYMLDSAMSGCDASGCSIVRSGTMAYCTEVHLL